METLKRILIIDDERDLAQMVKFQFKARGFEADTAADGVEGLEKVHLYKPDLIILDVNMPRMGGIEFYNKICGPNNKPLYPVLVLTARANIQELFKEFDIDGFMIKPFEIDQVVEEAEFIIKRRMRAVKKGPSGLVNVPRKVCIVENDAKAMEHIGLAFLNADYIVHPARSGTTAIERVKADVPDVALVQLGLEDISGDLVIGRLSQMSKTMEVKFILYTHRSNKHEKVVLDKFGEKSGVIQLIEYGDPQELVDAVDRLLL